MIPLMDDATNGEKVSTDKNHTGDKTRRVIPTRSVENGGVNSRPLQQANTIRREDNTSRYIRLLQNVTATMQTAIATNEGANTVDDIEEISASLQVAPQFISNMQQLRDSMSKPELALFYHQCLGLGHDNLIQLLVVTPPNLRADFKK